MALVYDPVTGRMVETNSTTAPAAPPVGIGLTPEQQAAQRRAQQQQAMADRITQTHQSAGRVVDQVAGGLGSAYGTVLNAATVVPRAAYGVATGEIPVTFDDRLPGQAAREAARAQQQSRQNAQWVADNPAEAQAAQQFGQDVVGRTRAAGLTPPAAILDWLHPHPNLPLHPYPNLPLWV